MINKRQWLQVQPWNNNDPWNQYGIVGFPHWTSTESRLGSNGIAGKPMVGINGHLGLLVAMMMIGGRRDHNGTVNQRSISTKVRLQNGTVIILRKPGATIVAH